ncbi:MAG: hypothetical protein GWM98_13825 [Nitrospinaceae bacterium]|nr:RDD family protein [Nitrospinaceae bacterium]NIR55355.1 RDD family protein [Nitrospinaceae bacterium]NIS85794.1 RDD family protein [Nitrospinaceae bacterium]NIT82644.1 RDD family protein [Nitrospinaceae bacterium]NIU44849.1 RDD family protein [Nitrospinaceae bacterium]
MKSARFGRRYSAFLMDIFFLEILGAVVTIPLVHSSNPSLAKAFIKGLISGRMTPEEIQLVAVYSLLLVASWILYFVGFTVFCGQTPGKRMFGLRVIREDGGPVDWATASVRYCFGYPVSLLPLGLGFYWALPDPDNQTWHDKVARTLVVETAAS